MDAANAVRARSTAKLSFKKDDIPYESQAASSPALEQARACVILGQVVLFLQSIKNNRNWLETAD
ncbi:hypothetical protein D0C27_15225 [Alcaligenes faecalis]|uniref:hypothetical protein n=1 Tax=Alcaligenes faecalis TaxID=511 RepID=UPI0009F40FEA|nr:hypothetical protein [Alcaligenes faecalis]MCB4321768.1 hypothetical protein [Alcaligenes sp. 13f]OQV31038.1 hypothetical protein BV899_08895 [Alcaligenes phenolicus]QCP83156.1 hypothetical protein D0C27_15225 [Alcaligenes faecalis]ULH07899.1 hypothetical protein MF263_05405 [Alcaligenes faecalis]